MNFDFQTGAVNMPELWLIVLIAMLVVEFSTVALTSIWFAGGAAAAFAASLLGAPLWLQIILFAAVSIVLLLTIRPLSVKFFMKKTERTNVDSLVGKDAVVTEDIDNLAGVGAATVDGVVWTARMKESDGKCSRGIICSVDHIEGVKLVLIAKEEN